MIAEIEPFVVAYQVLKVLEDEGAKHPSVLLFKDGTGVLILNPTDYNIAKSVAENLVLADQWFYDPYGNYCLHIKEGVLSEKEKVSDKSEDVEKS